MQQKWIEEVTSVAPWKTQSAGKVVFHTKLTSPCSNSDSDVVRKKASDDTIEARGVFDISMWTDGSVQGLFGAGAAMIWQHKDTVRTRAEAPAGFLSSSYQAEGIALQCGLSKIIGMKSIIKVRKDLMVCTDSQSNVAALQAGPLRQTNKLQSDVWSQLIDLIEAYGITRIVIQYVASHCGVSKNEAVDRLVDTALKKYCETKLGNDHKKAPIPLAAIKATAKQSLVNKYKSGLAMNSSHSTICNNKMSDLQLSSTLDRGDEVKLHRLRVGESLMMGKFRARLKLGSPVC